MIQKWTTSVACLIVLAQLVTLAVAEEPLSYNRDIRPILSDNCFHCHGPDPKSREADLRLDVRAAAVDYGAIVPSEAGESSIIDRIYETDPDVIMPPPRAHKKLSAKQKEILKRWVNEGAEYQEHWAYEELDRPALSQPANELLAENPIDAFIQKPLSKLGIKPSPIADRATLLRRLSLDLIGLPPTPTEVAAFKADTSADAYEKQVDRLLALPQYGERMAQSWLDLARYADTVGFHGDQNQNVWAYRDYVIKSFNENKPFDQFTREQLAGDLLPNPTEEQLTATCFNRLNMMTREGGAQPAEYLTIYTADRIRTVSQTWLGSTFACAQCHDHKFDPITQKDFYSLGAFFADVKQWGVYSDYGYTPNPDLRGFNNNYPFPPESEVESAYLVRKLTETKAKLQQLYRSASVENEALESWLAESLDYLSSQTTGWETPAPTVQQTNKKEKHKQPSFATVEKDQSILLTKKTPGEFQLVLAPASRRIASLKLELLPHEKHQDKLVSSGSRTTVKLSATLVRNGKQTGLKIRHASANHFSPDYRNGQAVIGVQSGWKPDRTALKQPHQAVYVLEQPIALLEGDKLLVKLASGKVGCLRVSVSPFSPADIAAADLPIDLVDQLQQPELAKVWYLRSSVEDRDTHSAIANFDRQVLNTRGGKTPVLVTEQTDKPLTVRLLARGDWQDNSGEICKPTTPSFLPTLPDADGKELSRLDLADWICAEDNPLTARVYVNRLWKQFFGTGLSAQVEDVGAQGEAPSHPELLDWLACEFRDGGNNGKWDVKHVVKQIVSSHTYQQSSKLRTELQESDPYNRLLASQNPRRLEAEIVRDNALAIAGLISLEMGGPPVKPYQPAGYYAGLQFPGRRYQADNGANQYRRGVYSHWQRTFLHPMLANFDAPSREDCIAMRTDSNSPQQALTLLNDPSFVEAARVWAEKLLASGDDDTDRLQMAFQQALARQPRPDETAGLLKFLDQARQEYRQRPEDAKKIIAVGKAPKSSTADPIELAAWTNAARVILNLHETINRY